MMESPLKPLMEKMTMIDKELIIKDIDAYLEKYEDKELLRFVAVGSVDDGKSTLIGRLLYETDGVYEDQLEEARAAAVDGVLDFALITDGLTAEREQGITIDVAYRYFHTSRRKFIIADTPGHVQYTRNMTTGASTANVAIILIDARLGVLQQSRRHAYIASLLGIPHLFVAINKMDLRDYDEQIYNEIVAEFRTFAAQLHFSDITYIPVSALKGDNIVKRSEKTAWYKGETLLEHLETVPIAEDRNFDDFRFPVQTVIRPNLNYRGFAGQIASGVIHKGDRIVALPSGKTSRIASIDTYDGELEYAFPPQSVVLRLEDEIDISRGDMIVREDKLPQISRSFEATIVWMNEEPLQPARSYFIKHTTQQLRVNINAVLWKTDPDTLEEIETETLLLNEIGRLHLTTHRPIFFDPYERNRSTGAFILVDALSNRTVGAGIIVAGQKEDQKADLEEMQSQYSYARTQVTKRERQSRLQQKGAAIWLTGLPSSGKSTIAYALERRLFDFGHVAIVIDPDDTASNLDREDHLFFASSDRSARNAQFARRTVDAGLLMINAFSNPSIEERQRARRMIGDDRFLEIHLATPELNCRKWDKRKLYQRLDAGDFQDVPTSYEKPSSPTLSIRPSETNEETNIEMIIEMLRERGILFTKKT